jgi:hypothetical protein
LARANRWPRLPQAHGETCWPPKLDVANGSSICITGVIFQANAFLKSVGYAGPGSYTISASQRAQAISFEQALDKYTNDSTSTSC